MDDEAILKMYAARHSRAADETAAKYGRLCFHVAMNILADERDAEECVNDTWMRAWNAIPPEHPSCLGGWLARVTRNLAVSRLRERHAEKRGGNTACLVLEELAECLPGSVDPQRELEQEELTRYINRFLSGLPPQERDVFVARVFFTASHKELSEKTGWSIGKVKTVLHRTRKKLRAYLKEEGLC